MSHHQHLQANVEIKAKPSLSQKATGQAKPSQAKAEAKAEKCRLTQNWTLSWPPINVLMRR